MYVIIRNMNENMPDQIDKVLEAQKAYLRTEKGKLVLKRYTASPKGKASQENYIKSEKGQLAQLRYYNSPKAQETRRKQKEKRDLLKAYAKYLKRNPGASVPDFLKSLEKETK